MKETTNQRVTFCPACESTGGCNCGNVEPLTVGEQVPLWNAINLYVRTCGGDDSSRIYGEHVATEGGRDGE